MGYQFDVQSFEKRMSEFWCIAKRLLWKTVFFFRWILGLGIVIGAIAAFINFYEERKRGIRLEVFEQEIGRPKTWPSGIVPATVVEWKLTTRMRRQTSYPYGYILEYKLELNGPIDQLKKISAVQNKRNQQNSNWILIFDFKDKDGFSIARFPVYSLGQFVDENGLLLGLTSEGASGEINVNAYTEAKICDIISNPDM